MLGLKELIERIGEDRINVQPLLSTVTNLRSLKLGGTSVTFTTDQITPNAGIGRADRFGLVIWLPMEDVERINAELSATPPRRSEEAKDADNA